MSSVSCLATAPCSHPRVSPGGSGTMAQSPEALAVLCLQLDAPGLGISLSLRTKLSDPKGTLRSPGPQSRMPSYGCWRNCGHACS